MILMAIDPAVKQLAYAIGESYITSIGVWKISIPSHARYKIINGAPHADNILIEVPRSYPGSPIRDNDLIDLALVCGSVLSIPYANGVYPRDWKGTIPKKVHQRRLLKKLSGSDVALLDDYKSNRSNYDKDIMDAIGIWYWYQERIKNGLVNV